MAWHGTVVVVVGVVLVVVLLLVVGGAVVGVVGVVDAGVGGDGDGTPTVGGRFTTGVLLAIDAGGVTFAGVVPLPPSGELGPGGFTPSAVRALVAVVPGVPPPFDSPEVAVD